MKRDRAFLLVLAAVFGLLAYLLVRPFLQYVLAGVLLTYVLWPVHRRLASRVGEQVSALALMVATTLVVVVPVGLVLAVAADQAFELVSAIRRGDLAVAEVEAFVERYAGVAVDLEAIDLRAFLRRSAGDGSALFGRALDVFGGVSTAFIGLTILAFVLYYLLRDGDAFLAWVRDVAPLPDDVQDELYEGMDRVMWAVLVGNVLVALVQGVLTGIGLAVAGVPSVVFLTVVTTLLSLLPLIGASVVWFPAAVYLFVVGRPVAAAFLFVYGTAVVSLSDNYLRPMISAHEARLNPAILVVGIFGGVYALGFMGLFFGPIVLGILRAVLDVFAREYA